MSVKLTNPWERVFSRRRLFKTAAGAAGAGAVLGSGVWVPARADEDDGKRECGPALPIPHLTGKNHFFFPGPVEGAPPSDPHFPNAGFDPSTITNFEGFIGQVDLNFSGMGTNLKTGAFAPFNFHTDTRFMKGEFIGADERRHHGAFAFI